MPHGNTILESDPSSKQELLEDPLFRKERRQQPGRDADRPPEAVAAISDSVVPALGLILTAGFFGLLFVLCFHTVPDPNLAMLNIVLGSLGTAWIGAMAYFFGSSRGSQTKDWMLYQSQPADQSRGINGVDR